MRKVLNVITLIVMLGVNIMNPFTYAISSGDDFEEIQNLDEIVQEDGDFDGEEKIDTEEEKDEILDEDQDTEEDTDIDEEDENTDEIEEINENTDEEAENKEENNETSDIEQEDEINEDDNQDEETDENNHSGEEIEDEDDENSTPIEVVDEIVENEIEELSGDIAELTGEVVELTGNTLELSIARETLNETLIQKSEYYNGVTVNVEAQPGNFLEGTELRINPITLKKELNEIKEQIIDSQENVSEESELVAFDISFIYILSGGEEIELQPKNSDGVKVIFNYENNENLSEADVNEEQEIKVFHIDDKDDNGLGEVKDVTNKVESEEAGIAVADAKSFSIYAVVTTTGSPDTINVTHNLNGGYWLDGNDLADPRTIEYTCTNNSCTTTTHYRTPKKDGYMFMGWYDQTLTNRRKDGVATDGMTVYAKWQDFNDLNVYVLKDNDHKYQYTLMDRNMGATGIYTNSLTINPESRGYYYQWGNNYGFDSYAENNGALSNSGTTKINVSGFSWNEPYYSATFVKQTAQNNAEWTTGLNRDLWGDGNIKTNEAKQGPCPSGYHIPSEDDWKGVLSGWTSVNYRENKNFYFDFLIPSAGIRNRGYNNQNVAKVVDIGRYRYASSSRDGTNFDVKAVILLTSTGINVLPVVSYHVSNPKDMAYERSSNGLSVRCFKNTTGGVIDASNIDLNGGGGGILSITSGVVVSFQSPTRGNDEFLGFYTNSGYLGEPIDSVGDIIPEGTTYLYAKWNVGGLYTITYHDAIETDVVYTGAYGTSTADAVAPTWSKEGYTLTWSAEKPSTYPAENIIINSVWTANTYKIHFNGNGATSGSMVDQDFTYDEGLKPLTANIFENEGYLFKGWATSPNGIIIYSDEEPVQNLRSQSGAVVNLYAKWGEQCGEYEEEGPDGNCYISAEGQRIAQIVSDLDMFLLVSDGNAYNKHVTLMDRNMGATDRFDGNMSNPNEGSKGYLYQWGNNYGFPSTGTLAEHNVFTTTGQTKKTDWEKGIPSKYSSMIYYLNSDNNGNWMQGSSTSDGIWGGTGDTTDTMGPTTSSEGRQGPCPVGYHVPSSVEYSGLYLIYQTIKSKNKEDFSKDFLIPPVGRRAGNGNLGNTGDISYWSSSPHPGNSNRALGVWRSDSEMKIGNDDGRARARSVRCVKNVANTRATTIDINDIHLNGGTKVFISIDSGVILTLGNPTLTNGQLEVADFSGWYTTSDFSGNPITTGMNIEAGSSLYAKYTCKDSEKVWNGSDCVTAESSVLAESNDENKGSVSVTPGPYTYGKRIVFSANSKRGYILEKWVLNGNPVMTGDNKDEFWTGDLVIENLTGDVIVTGFFIGDMNTYTVHHRKQNIYDDDYSGVNMMSETGYGITDTLTNAEPKPFSGFTLSGGVTQKNIEASGSTVIDIYYTRNIYKITFDSDGGSEVPPIPGKYEIIITEPDNPEKDGYTFTGWFYGETKIEFPIPMPLNGTGLTAHWIANTGTEYKVEYYLQNEDLTGYNFHLTGTQYGTSDTQGVAEVKDFTGFEFNATHSGNITSGTIAGDGSLVLRLFYDRKSYTISTGTNDETMGTVSYEGEPRHGKKIIFTAHRSIGYILDRREVNGDTYYSGSVLWTGDTLEIELTGDLAVTGHFSAEIYKIIYHDTNNVEIDEVFTGTYNQPTTNVKIPTWSKDGYTLTWDREKPETYPAEDTVINSVWTIHTGTVKYVYTGDIPSNPTELPEETTYNYGDALEALPTVSPVDGYTFEGWEGFPADGKMPDYNVVVTGTWTVNEYTITYHDAIETDVVYTGAYGTSTADAVAPVWLKTGYTLSWSGNVPATYPAHNVVIDSVWTANTYKVHFNGNGATSGSMTDQDFTYDAAEQQLTANTFEKEGHSFAGWATSSDGAKVYDDKESVHNLTSQSGGVVNLYALWSVDSREENCDTSLLSLGQTPKPGATKFIQTWDDTEGKFLPLPIEKSWTYDGVECGYLCDTSNHYEYSGGECVLEQYTITFYKDGVKIGEKTVSYGSDANDEGINKTKESTAQTGYTFTGWYKLPEGGDKDDLTNVIANRNVYARYDESTLSYEITWNYRDEKGERTGNTINVEYGKNPTEPSYSTTIQTAQTGYTFIRWNPTIIPVETGAEYTAQYEEKINKYIVTIKTDANSGSISTGTLEIEYGTVITTSGNELRIGEEVVSEAIAKPREPKYSHRFVSWINSCGATVTTGCEITANFESTVNEYLIKFIDGDGEVIQSEMVAYGETPEYTGETPKKTSTAQTGYTFNETWSPSIIPVETGAEYIAQFNEETRSYDIIWNYRDEKGERTGNTINVEYGKNPTQPSYPTTIQTAQTGYTFIRWNPAIIPVETGAEYTAQYEEITREYLIKFIDGNGEVIQSGMVAYGETPEYTGETPKKTSTAQTGYIFNGNWNPVIIPVETGVEYTAQFDETINKYTVTINADTNSGSVSTGTLEIEYGAPITESGNQLKIGDTTVIATATPSDAQYTHRFVDWTNSCGATVTTGCEITANFESTVNKYQITFESNGGSDVKSWTGEYGALVSKPADPTKTGYGFSGWFYEGLETKFDFETTTISGDLTLYAKWTPIIYTISYNYNSGSLTGELTNPSSYTIETDTFTLNNPERVGYDFLGWTGTDFEGLSGTVTIMSGSTGNREYTANWQARNDITLTINHYFQDLDENTNKLKTTYTLSGTTTSLETADDTIILSNYSGNFDGYIYDYGKVDVDGEPVETTTVLPNGNRVINLYYTRKLYSFTLITYTGSTTTGTTPSGPYYYGAKIILSGDTDSDCFMWNKWNIDGTTLENNMKQTSFHMPAGNVIAQSLVIEKTYNIVFNGNGATSGEMAELTGLRCTQSVDLPINKFEKVGHAFSGWTTTIGGQKEYNDGETIPPLTTGNNVTVDLIAIWDINKYTVTWINSDGSTIKTDTGVEHGTYLEYIGDTPTSGGNAQYTYEFAGWTPEIGEITGNTTYTATYIPTINKYTISWDIDGNIIEEEYEYGDTPNYTGLIHKNSTEQYEYSFSGWNPSISTVEGDKTYTATFTPILRTYTVTWINSDGSGLETDYNIPYGTMPHYDGDKPTKPGDSQHTYTFTGWAPELKIVTGDATYTAIYESIDNKYTVTWQNEDGTPLKIDYDVPYGTIPVYSGTTPTKPSDAQYDYTFDGWSPEPGAVEGDQVYVAKYKPTPRTYTVTWINSDGNILLTGKWTYGVTPVYSGDTPTSGGNAQYSYQFAGWNPTVSEVEGDITYTAVYSHTVNTYTVLWKNRDGTVLETGENIPYGVTPTHGDITPTKPSTAQYSYKFIGWEPEISAVTGNISYVAKFDPIVNNYNVKFIDDNGSILKEIIQYPYGTSWEAIEKPATPTKQQDDQYTYEFAGWTPIVTEITGDVTFKATYTSTLRSYTVTWKNRNGTVLKTDENVLYGTMPVYSGATPTKPSTAQYSYVFTGWDPELSEIHGDVTYTAQFEEATEYYTVTWQNEDGTTLKIDYNLPYGTTPVYSGATPTKSGNIQYDYIFDGWNPDIVPVTSNATYVAKFKSEVKEYTVIWKNRNGTTLEIDLNVPYGSTPSYDGATPTKPSTPQYSYEFDKWTPNVDTVEGNMIYTATFREIINKYVVTWENYDGSVLSSGEVEYGVVPSYSGDTPSKNGDAQYSYTFNGWDKEISQVHEDTIYMATYTQSVNEYLITFKDGDGNTIQTGMVAYGETPIYSGATPTKTADAQYTYTFNNTWNPAIIPVTTGAEYTAQFDKTTNKYTVTIGANSNSGSVSTGIIEVEYGTPITIEGNKLKIGNITITATATGRTAQYTHEFSGWNNSCGISLQSGCTIEAEFRSIVNEYLIIFKDGDGNTIQTGMVAYGETPVYGGATPTKTADAQYTYTFNNTWSPTIIPVETGAEYTAQFDSTVNKYLITFEDGDGNIIRTGMVAYGEIPVYGGATPTKTATAQYTYIFNNTWSPELTGVTKAQIYAAQFDSIINKYTVTWNNEDGMQLEKDENVPYGSAPSYDGVTPVKPGDDSGNYIFNGWNPTPINVIGDAVYTAKYKEKETPQEDKGNRRSGGGGRKYTTSEEIDQHGSAEDIDNPSNPEKEVFDAYKRAYKYGITTIDNEQEADPDGYVTRGHLAKMVVNFTVNVLGREMPVDTPTKCKRKDKDSEWESNEIKFYAEKACALGVMGLYTEEFMPNKIVNRAEFGTVVSRLLWGNRYDELDTDNNLFYTKHLKALQESGFMKDIDNPLGRKEFRKRVWITLKRIELEKKE